MRVRVKVLERCKDKYLIERYYKKLDLVEYIVCENYDFKSNTYAIGVVILSLPTAYKIYNDYVSKDVLPLYEDDVDGQD